MYDRPQRLPINEKNHFYRAKKISLLVYSRKTSISLIYDSLKSIYRTITNWYLTKRSRWKLIFFLNWLDHVRPSVFGKWDEYCDSSFVISFFLSLFFLSFLFFHTNLHVHERKSIWLNEDNGTCLSFRCQTKRSKERDTSTANNRYNNKLKKKRNYLPIKYVFTQIGRPKGNSS